MNVLSFGAAMSTLLGRYGFDWRPEAGIAVVRLTGGHTAETGRGMIGAFAVHGDLPALTSVKPYVDLAISREFLTASQLAVQPEVSVGYELEAGNRDEAAVIFAADGTAFATPHNKPDGSAATVGAGVEAGRGNWSVFGRYDAEIAGNWAAQTVEAGVSVRF
jgi:outer membrane autotransporter protein